MRGLRAPAPQPKAIIHRDEAGRLQRLEQSDWDIQYTRFEHIDGWNWPRRLNLATGELVVRLVIDEWVLPVPDAGAAPQPASVTAP